MSHELRRCATALAFAVIVLGAAPPTDAARRTPVDVAGSLWTIPTTTRVVVIAQGIGTSVSPPTRSEVQFTFAGDGSFSMFDGAETYDGTWTQDGRRVTLAYGPELAADLLAECDDALGSCEVIQVKGKLTSTARGDNEYVRLRVRVRFKARFRGVNFRFLAKIRGKAKRPLIALDRAARLGPGAGE